MTGSRLLIGRCPTGALVFDAAYPTPTLRALARYRPAAPPAWLCVLW
ncbi:hypothetical protein [uncultured Chloroflexus sp.]|nr:hypothetical protein [uncultured Chloroflexus sp.]